MIHVEGVQVPRVAMADLALELREGGDHVLADEIMNALARNADSIHLDHGQRERLLAALDHPPLALAHLRDALAERR